MNKKLTIIKVLPGDEDLQVTVGDLERWKQIFVEKRMTLDEARATGEVEIEVIPTPEPGEDENYLTVVRVGGEDYHPTFEELENWRDIFKEAQGDPDFKIFTHPAVEVSVVKIGDIVAVE